MPVEQVPRARCGTATMTPPSPPPSDKTMLFGKIDTFAIEAMPEPHLQPPSQVWGRMRIWCEGCEIGDFEDPFCGLYTSYMGFHALRDRLSSLWLDEFEGLSDQELWNLLDGALYGYHGDIPLADERSLEEVQRDSARYEPFDFLTNWGEQFDQGGKSFIVYTPAGRVRILNRSLPPARGLALEASLVDVTEAIDGFTAWFEQESERLGEPSVE